MQVGESCYLWKKPLWRSRQYHGRTALKPLCEIIQALFAIGLRWCLFVSPHDVAHIQGTKRRVYLNEQQKWPLNTRQSRAVAPFGHRRHSFALVSQPGNHHMGSTLWWNRYVGWPSHGTGHCTYFLFQFRSYMYLWRLLTHCVGLVNTRSSSAVHRKSNRDCKAIMKLNVNITLVI